MQLFEAKVPDHHQPLAERMRPSDLSEVIGQSHLLGDDGLISRLVAAQTIPSMMLWGPPGVGKTTLADCWRRAPARLEAMSAVQAGVSELKVILARAHDRLGYHGQRTVLFLDEIHRFNKAQQDVLLPHIESGRLILIGATTENPGFAVIPALRSRCMSVALHALSLDELARVLKRGAAVLERELTTPAIERIIRTAQGDARRCLNLLEWSHHLVPQGPLTEEAVSVADRCGSP